MEYSYKHTSGSEGCSSSESGWTMYISSSMEEDDVEFNSNESDDKIKSNIVYHKDHARKPEYDIGSDDSMASDASSGLRIPCYTHSHGEGSRVVARVKHDKKQSENKSTKKKEKKSGEKSTKRKL